MSLTASFPVSRTFDISGGWREVKLAEDVRSMEGLNIDTIACPRKAAATEEVPHGGVT